MAGATFAASDGASGADSVNEGAWTWGTVAEGGPEIPEGTAAARPETTWAWTPGAVARTNDRTAAKAAFTSRF